MPLIIGVLVWLATDNIWWGIIVMLLLATYMGGNL